MESSKKIYIQCACHSIEHLLVASIEDFSTKKHPKDIMFYFDIQLNHYLPWYKRVFLAIKYAFGFKSSIGHWDNIIIFPEDAVELKNLLVEYIDKATN